MRRGTSFLYGILAFALLAFAVLNVRMLKYVRDPDLSPLAARGETTPLPPADIFRGIAAPHAVVVLDISGSMQTSDPGKFESEAFLQFFRVYRNLSREVLARGDRAQLAVVLFSTLAQVVDWRGNGSPWLDVGSVDAEHAVAMLAEKFLGTVREDHRSGQDTDYLAAFREIAALVRDLPSPPVVLFLTDGVNEPHQLFSPLVAVEDRKRKAVTLPASARDAVERAIAGRLRFIDLNGSERPFDRKRFGIGRPELTTGEAAAAPEAVRRARADLLSLRFPWTDGSKVCAVWTPIFLGAGGEHLDRNSREGLESDANCGPWRQNVTICEDSRDLPSEFVGALGEWFQLQKLEVPTGAGTLQVPAQTQAFSVVVKTSQAGSRFELISGNRAVRLEGRGGLWAGVATGSGEWTFRTDAGSVVSGTLYARPRFQWVLRSPQWIQTAGRNDQLELDLALVSSETTGLVDAGSVYSKLPHELQGNVELPVGGSSTKLHFERLVSAPSGPTAAFRARVAIGAGIYGTARASVDLAPLVQAGIPVRAELLSRTVEVRPSLRIVLKDPSGRETRLNLRNLPREGAWLRQVMSTRTGER